MTAFGVILQHAVQATPNAVGGSFAAPDGELVDSYATMDAHEWAVLTAYYGVVMAQLTSAFDTWHHGGPEFFIAQHATLDVVVHAVDAGYFALLAMTRPSNLAFALANIRTASVALRREMS